MRVVVAGLIGSIPFAGLTLHYLQYVLGLRELGHDVLYLEDTGGWYHDPATDTYFPPETMESSALPVRYIKTTMDAYGLGDSWTYVDRRGVPCGVTGTTLKEFLSTADLFVHVTGAGQLRDEYLKISRRAYVDTDPGYVQLRVAGGSQRELEVLERHTVHFSYGCNVGAADCRIPTVGFQWLPTVQPVCMWLWPVTPAPAPEAAFTTILKWRTYPAVEYGDEVFGLKDMEFAQFLHLPTMTSQPLEIAMAGDPPADDFEAVGWRRRSGPVVSSTTASYRRYIQGSRGEWSIAKNCYVKTRSGWFGDRSAAYLASGRPVVLQSTGFERWLPTGRGAFGFSTVEEARLAIEAINGSYRGHCRAARELAESYFDSRNVLGGLIDRSMSA